MHLTFCDVSSLLQKLEDVERHEPPLILPSRRQKAIQSETESWFKAHRHMIDGLGIKQAVALLSSLLPERRTDRVYGMQASSLGRILCRGLSLGSSRAKDLQAYRHPGQGDLGQCLQRVLAASGPAGRPAVTLDEVDDMLHELAAQCRFSGPAIATKPPTSSSAKRDELIGGIFRRLSPLEGKWLVRLILKDFSPVTVDEFLVLRSFHFLLPDLLRFQNDFDVAIALLKDQHFRQYPAQPDRRSFAGYRESAAPALTPAVGVKVGRPEFQKARSIDHCLKMLGPYSWVLERKYDGEYCEIHIDSTRGANPAQWIRVFSKSGKDSTLDRKGVHETLVKCLSLGTAQCKIKKRAILLGELVVYSDQTRCILPFDKLRKHVSRSGSFLGTNHDSQKHAHEHLAIVFFDLLLLDDEVVMARPVEERRNWLREVYRKVPGRAMGAEWKIVKFADRQRARKLLIQQFSASIAQRCEGLILKPCSVPYFPLEPGRRSYIKLKKDYITSMGDEADFAVIGASYDAQQALKCRLRGITWTDFHLGCLLNAAAVQRFDDRPCFQYVGTIQQEACVPTPILKALNEIGAHRAKPYDSEHPPSNFDIRAPKNAKIDTIFDIPFVVEVLGSGFDKPANSDFYMLRHARVTKLHQDRSWKESISFSALQEQAHAARGAPDESESQETRKWIARIESKCNRRLERDGTLTPGSSASKTSTSATSGRIRQSPLGSITSPASRGHASSENVRVKLGSEGTAPVEVQQLERTKRPELNASTSCPPRKKRRVREDNETVIIVDHAGRAQDAPAPLSDITDRVLQPRHDDSGSMNAQHRWNPDKRPDITRERRITSIAGLPTPPSTSGQCTTGGCLFAHAVVYLGPCIATTAYITEDLLSPHGSTIVKRLEYWDRDSYAHPSLTCVVSESQAYDEMRKVVLVEHNRVQAVQGIIQQIVGLNGGRLKERIELYDWRVLKACTSHEIGAGEVKDWFVGATMFDEVRKRTMFVSRIPGLTLA